MKRMGVRTTRSELLKVLIFMLVAGLAGVLLFVRAPYAEKQRITQLQQRLATPPPSQLQVHPDTQTAQVPETAFADRTPEQVQNELRNAARQSGMKVVAVRVDGGKYLVTVSGKASALVRFGQRATALRLVRGGQIRGQGRFYHATALRALGENSWIVTFEAPQR